MNCTNLDLPAQSAPPAQLVHRDLLAHPVHQDLLGQQVCADQQVRPVQLALLVLLGRLGQQGCGDQQAQPEPVDQIAESWSAVMGGQSLIVMGGLFTEVQLKALGVPGSGWMDSSHAILPHLVATQMWVLTSIAFALDHHSGEDVT